MAFGREVITLTIKLPDWLTANLPHSIYMDKDLMARSRVTLIVIAT